MSVTIFDVTEILATLGLTPREIDLVVCTHVDADHSGNHDRFPCSELIVQRHQYDVARAMINTRWSITRPHRDHPALRYRLLDGDIELVPGMLLIETSGHVPGHQAVLVRLPKGGSVLLAIDAAACAEDFAGEMDPAGFRQSIHKRIDLVRREQDALDQRSAGLCSGHTPWWYLPIRAAGAC